MPTPPSKRGIAAARWPGRLERISERPEIILDGAHNPAGARALAAYIDRFYAGRNVWLIYGAMRDKAIDEIGGILFPRARHVIHGPAPGARRLSRGHRPLVDHSDVRTAPTLADALAMVRGAAPEDVIFITGSLFLVAEARALVPVMIERTMSLLRSCCSHPADHAATIVMGTLSLIDSFFDTSGNSQHRSRASGAHAAGRQPHPRPRRRASKTSTPRPATSSSRITRA